MRYDNWAVAGFDRDAAAGLYRRGINPLAAVFMCARGITDYDEAVGLLEDLCLGG